MTYQPLPPEDGSVTHQSPGRAMRDIAEANKAAGATRPAVEETLRALVAHHNLELIQPTLDLVFGHNEHTFLVAFVVSGGSRESAQLALIRALRARLPGNTLLPGSVVVEEWWVAEEDRLDHSDNESAAFVPIEISPARARAILERAVADVPGSES